MNQQFFLQGPGVCADAVFEVDGTAHVRVTAETGMTGCYLDRLPVEDARAVYRELVARGWSRVQTPRRSAREIAMSING